MAKWNKKNKKEYNKARREWYQKNKESERARLRISNQKRLKKILSWVQTYKRNKGCRFCPENEPVCLDFHHDSGEKEGNIANKYKSWSQEKLEKELEKCIVVCANCHRKLHYLNTDPSSLNGQAPGYELGDM